MIVLVLVHGPTSWSLPRAASLAVIVPGSRPHRNPVEREARRQLEVVARQQLGVGQQLVAFGVGDDAAVGEDHRSLAQLGRQRKVVCGDQHRAIDALEDVEQLAPGTRVEVGGRLVEHEQARAHGEHGGDRHAPALAHRQLERRPLGGALHADGGECLRHAPLDLRARQALVERAERHVLRDGRHEELVVRVLEDESHARA